MEGYVIPRNIKVKETIIYGLDKKQIIYIAIGLGGAVLFWTSGIPFLGIIEKAVGGIFCIAGGLAFSTAKAYGQDLDAYAINSVKYALRTKEFEGGSGNDNSKSPILHIRYNT